MASRKINLDWPLVFTALALTAFGILMVYSAGRTDVTRAAVANAYRMQLIWLVVALIGAFAMTRASVRLIEWMTVPLYAFAIFLLMLVLVPGFGSGSGTAKGVKGWLTIPGGPKLGQPVEFAKLAVVLMLARLLGQSKKSPRSTLELWRPILAVVVPVALIAKQPDVGSAMVFVGIFFGMLYWTGVPARLLLLLASPVISMILPFNAAIWATWYFLFLALLIWYRPYVMEGILLAVVNVAMGMLGPWVWDNFDPYQRNRVLSFIDPNIDPRGASYHVNQSMVSIGSGGWFGSGFGTGPLKRLGFLPEQHTDFIFAVLGEEMGFIGVTVALTLFLVLFLRTVRIAERANDSFSSLVAFGLLAGWFVHVLINVGMTLNLMPITGIPLPFFSYGGTFMLASWLAVGVLVRIAHEGRGGKHGPFAI
jgi:rod shape determining protein RodA